jgi:hypothetical protein
MTTRGFDLIAIISVVWFVTSPLFAHPGGHGHIANDLQGSRTWTFLAEGSHLHGTFVAAKEGNVQIRRDNGVLTTVALARLVPADQQWIKNRLAEIERLNTDQSSLFVVQKPRPSQNEKQQALPLPAPAMLEHFKPFEKALKLRWD